MSSNKCAPAPVAQIMRAGKIPTANFGYLRPVNQEAAATATMIATVPTSECVDVRWPRKNVSAPPSRVTQSTSAIRPDTSSIGVAARVILFSPARPRAIEVKACVTGSIELRLISLEWRGLQPAGFRSCKDKPPQAEARATHAAMSWIATSTNAAGDITTDQAWRG